MNPRIKKRIKKGNREEGPRREDVGKRVRVWRRRRRRRMGKGVC